MSRLFHHDLRAVIARARSFRRRKTPSDGPRLTRPAWQVFRTGFERLEDRTMLSGITSDQMSGLGHRLLTAGGLGAQLDSSNRPGQDLLRIAPAPQGSLPGGAAVVDAVPLSSFPAFAQGQPAPMQVVIVDGAVPNYE